MTLMPVPVSRLAALLREVVEDNFVQVLVEGEVSNLASPASGHLYFTLKDEQAQIRAVMFRPQNRLLRFRPENGLQVVCGGRVTVYPQRGDLQLVVETMEPIGLGGLQLAFEQLKRTLAAEGLFAAERKRPLPAFPETIGIVTSTSGAAIHDILQVLRRRGPGVRVVLAPVKVQGEGAAEEIATAIADLNRLGGIDVLIVGRGGGSLEDLWSFNEELVARAIVASAIPVISAVGHEVDVTIADLAADLRAPTPSAAAELVIKSRLELEGHVDHLILRLTGGVEGELELMRERIDSLQRRLRSPRQELARRCAHLDQVTARLQLGMRNLLERRRLEQEGLLTTLDALSPLRTLARGYAVVRHEKGGAPLLSSEETEVGEQLQVCLAKGGVRVRVVELLP